MSITKVFLLQIWISTVAAVYYDDTFITIKPDMLPRNDSNFGYSVAYFDKWLIISAPTANNIGQISIYDIITTNLHTANIKIEREFPDYFTHDYWLGAYIENGPSFVVTCAPRTVYQYQGKVTRGECFKITKDGVIQLPHIDGKSQRYLNGGIDGFGWTIDVDSKNNIMIGGHGTESGAVRVHHNDYSKASMLNLTNTIYNFGYSVTSGNFLSSKKITYAISSTYGHNGTGEVFFYSEALERNKQNLFDSKVGSLYGAALCAVRLEGSLSSLLVGAPAFDGKYGYDSGAVYLYVPDFQSRIEKVPTLKTTLYGTVSGGYFGSAIVSVGDMDGDGKDEVAIGAPYEGNGAVYIYTGHGLLLGKTWIQKIQSEKHTSFGYSLTPIDEGYGRGCNAVTGAFFNINWCFTELAVGAPLSNVAFIMKCIPVVTATMSAHFPNIQKREDKTSFVLNVCINVIYPTKPQNIQMLFEIKIKLTHPNAKFEETDDDGIYTKNLIFQKSKSTKECQTINVLTPEGNYDQHLKFNITSALVKQGLRTSETNVVLSDRSVLSIEKSVWAADCHQQYGRCKPKLTAEVTPVMSTPYKVGVRETERITLLVNNSGDIAYDPCVVLSVRGTVVHRPPLACIILDNDKRRLLCKPSQPVPSGFKWSIEDIEIVTSVTNEVETIDIQYDVHNHCDNMTNTDDMFTDSVSYPLIFDYSKISVTGVSHPSKIINVYQGEDSNSIHIQHMYTITNNGFIDYVQAKCEIVFRKRSYFKLQEPMTKYSKGNDVSSEGCVIEEKGSLLRVSCYLNRLTPGSETNVLVPMDVLPNAIDIKEGNVTVFSKLRLYLLNTFRNESVTTTLTVSTISIPLWVWITAVLIALFILLITVLILYQLGCCRRENKERLRDLQSSQKQNQFQNAEGEGVTYSTLLQNREEPLVQT